MQIPEPKFELKGPEAIQQRISELRARLGLKNKAEFKDVLAQNTDPLSGLIGTPPSEGELHPMDPSMFGATIGNGARANKVQMQALVTQVAKEQNIDVTLLRAVVEAESDFNPSEVSNKGALGLMQLMPGTAKELGVTNPFDPYQNLTGGSKYLKQLLARYQGNTEIALAAYNAGPGNVDKAGGVPNFAETKKYVDKILRRIGQR